MKMNELTPGDLFRRIDGKIYELISSTWICYEGVDECVMDYKLVSNGIIEVPPIDYNDVRLSMEQLDEEVWKLEGWAKLSQLGFMDVFRFAGEPKNQLWVIKGKMTGYNKNYFLLENEEEEEKEIILDISEDRAVKKISV